MKSRWKFTTLAAVALVLVLSLTGVALAAGTAEEGATPGSVTAATPTLSQHVEKHLVVLREEEKLARDVYAVLYAKWNVPAFRTIGAAENRLMAEVKVLLDRYVIEDPVGTNPPGVFTNEKLQKAYGELVAKGAKSLTEAYKVGVYIEQRIINNVSDLLGDMNRPDITRVAKDILWSSQNHRAAFNRLLNK